MQDKVASRGVCWNEPVHWHLQSRPVRASTHSHCGPLEDPRDAATADRCWQWGGHGGQAGQDSAVCGGQLSLHRPLQGRSALSGLSLFCDLGCLCLSCVCVAVSLFLCDCLSVYICPVSLSLCLRVYVFLSQCDCLVSISPVFLSLDCLSVSQSLFLCVSPSPLSVPVALSPSHITVFLF